MDGMFQALVNRWMIKCFGPAVSINKQERNDRVVEESIELGQACGMTRERCHALVDYVFNRPAGEVEQEIGGVMVCLAALCTAHSIDMDSAALFELGRCNANIEKIREKQKIKASLGFSMNVEENNGH